MKAVIIYDSVFGNTEKVALAIRDALVEVCDASAFRIGDATLDMVTVADVLVVGSPTRGFNPTKEVTQFLKSIPHGALAGKKVAAFDTRIDVVKVNNGFLSFMVKLFGYADGTIAKLLAKKGGMLAAEQGQFVVNDSEGPMRDGELERAAEWAKSLLS